MPLPSVLIADDDRGLLGVLRLALEPLGVQVRDADSAISALLAIHESPPDVVILDINMPAGNGLCVCEMLASDATLSRLPVIMITGDSSSRARSRCLAAGARYVQKGADAMEEIKCIVRQILSDINARVMKSQLVMG